MRRKQCRSASDDCLHHWNSIEKQMFVAFSSRLIVDKWVQVDIARWTKYRSLNRTRRHKLNYFEWIVFHHHRLVWCINLIENKHADVRTNDSTRSKKQTFQSIPNKRRTIFSIYFILDDAFEKVFFLFKVTLISKVSVFEEKKKG